MLATRPVQSYVILINFGHYNKGNKGIIQWTFLFMINLHGNVGWDLGNVSQMVDTNTEYLFWVSANYLLNLANYVTWEVLNEVTNLVT